MEIEEMADLLPCPFCGDEYPEMRREDFTFCVYCTAVDCFCAVGEAYDGCAMPKHIFVNEEEATAAWNRRPAITRDDIEKPQP
jgi:hypothetical protein